MGTELGNIEAVELIGTELIITGHKWVGIAFAFDDAYQITRFVGVHSAEICEEKIEHLLSASDVYDCEINKNEFGCSGRFIIFNKTEVCFECLDVVTEFRYYTEDEMRDIFAWLASKSTPEEIEKYIEHIERHGFCVTKAAGNFSFNRVSQSKKTL